MTFDEVIALAAGGCQEPDCDHRHSGPLFLHARCHMEAKLDVTIDPTTRTLHVRCGACQRPVVEVTRS
jgi:hypothetical protein